MSGSITYSYVVAYIPLSLHLSINSPYRRKRAEEAENTIDGLSGRAIISSLINWIDFSKKITCWS